MVNEFVTRLEGYNLSDLLKVGDFLDVEAQQKQKDLSEARLISMALIGMCILVMVSVGIAINAIESSVYDGPVSASLDESID